MIVFVIVITVSVVSPTKMQALIVVTLSERFAGLAALVRPHAHPP